METELIKLYVYLFRGNLRDTVVSISIVFDGGVPVVQGLVRPAVGLIWVVDQQGSHTVLTTSRHVDHFTQAGGS